METANAERPISGTYEGNTENEPDLQLPLSVECSEKSSYEQGSPPICYVDLGGHKSTEPDFAEQQSSVDSRICDSPPELARDDRVSERKEADKADPPLFNVVILNSVEQSSLIVKDGDTDGCASIISAPAQCVVSSSIVQDQKNTTTTLVPGPLINCPPSDKADNTGVVVDVEKVAMEIDDDDDVDDRPLILDLGDTVNTPSPAESPAPPVVIVSEEAPGTFRRPPPPPKTLPRSTSKVSSVASTTTTTVTITSTPAYRVQKPIRPFIPQHFNSLEGSSGSHVSTTVPVSPTSASHHLTTPSLSATTIRLQTLPSQPPPLPPPPGPSTPSAAASPQQTNGVQFMSVLTPPPSVSSAVSPSPIHLFNLAAMPGYLNTASGVLFQSIPSTTVTTGGGGGGGGSNTTGPGGFQFTAPPPPPPPLFAPQAFPPPPPPPHFARSPSNLSTASTSAPTAGSLPPPPPLAPAPGLTSVQHTGATRTPVTGLFIPDMSTWMATVTGAQSIPPLQPLFSAQPASLTTATISSGEVIYSTVVTAVTTTPTTTATTTSSSVSSRLTNVQCSSPSLTSTTSLKTDGEKSLTPTPVNGGAATPFPNLSISARRWRPSLGRKCSVATTINSGITITGMCSSKTTVDKAVTTVVSPSVAVSTTTVSKSSTTAVAMSSSSNPSVTAVEALVSKARSAVHTPSRKRLHEELATRRKDANASMTKSEAMDSAVPKEERAEVVGKEAKVKSRTEVFSPPSSTVPSLLPPLPPLPIQSKSRTHPPKKTMRPPSSPAPPVAQFTAERKIISHFIDGHVLYESNLPFPVRNAMAVVRATLKCNGDAKPHEIVSTESVHITNHDQDDAAHEESKPNGTANGEHLPLVAASEKAIHRKHSIGLPPDSHRKRRLSKSEALRGCDTERHVEEEAEDAVVEKKKCKKSMSIYAVPFVTIDDGAVPMSIQNGHKEMPVSSDPPATNSKTKGEEGKMTVPTSAKVVTTVNLSSPTGSVTTASAPEPAVMPNTTTTDTPTGGSVGNGLRMTIHPVYQTVSRTSTPTAKLSATTSSLATKPAPTSPPPQPVVPTPPSSTSSSAILTVPQSLPSSATLRTHPTSIAKPLMSTTVTTMVTNTASSGGISARLQQLPPPLRKPMKSWSPSLVAEFVRGTPSCSTYADAFVENEIDGEALLLLTPAHFIDEPIKMKIGHALKLAHRVRQIVDPTYDSSASTAPIGGSSAGNAV
ncbi:Polyhomeotic-proximal chromatin protein [Taenia crassiceps]|uniref:Polyhomeotic-proximal chromatin protein n=1 Tax=Taenia crassiceps TaxID=6207 RepID=A0ABR4QEN5_9CEST